MREALEMRPGGGRAGRFEVGSAPGADASDAQDQVHPLDTEANQREFRRLLSWYYHEREQQADNRLEMAFDADMYDNEQWAPDDAQEVKARGQMPLVYNEVAPMVDWVIGTERRTRVDWRVLPRTEDDVLQADTKTKVLKYVSDANMVPFARSRAFADAVKAGVGWLDDGVCDDPDKDIIYSKYEDWRNVLWDSSSYEPDLSDARYVFRWRWVDQDIAEAMFPDRVEQIRAAVHETTGRSAGGPDDDMPGGSAVTGGLMSGVGAMLSSTGVSVDASRPRVRLIECQFRKPVKVHVVAEGAFKGDVVHPHDTVLINAVAQSGAATTERIQQRVHFAVFTDGALLDLSASPYRHNRFTLTPIWCYRRGKNRLPYGLIRRVRDVQLDLNKRASKALFMLNTNQIIAEKGAVDDWEEARDEVDRPDGLVVVNPNKRFDIRRDTDAATGQLQMMTMAAQSIQKSAGVSQENLGRQTNAVSGEAIKARQLQGSVVTTEPFDNLRLATQVQGEKQLSMTEQFYTAEKVIRLTGAKGALDWVHVNRPEVQPDGSVRILNDITASKADYIVSEQDYAGTMRQVMFESLNQMAMRLPPEVSLRLMVIAMEFSDLPNKDEVAAQIRQILGERDPSKEPTPEEEAAAEQQMRQQAETVELSRQQAIEALNEQRARVREINARAQELEARAMAASSQHAPGTVQQAIGSVREAGATELEAMSEELQRLQREVTSKALQVRTAADTELEVARIRAASAERVAEISAGSSARLDQLASRLDGIESAMRALDSGVKESPAQQPA